MPGHSRSKNGVASLAYVPGIHVLSLSSLKDVDGRDKPGHDDRMCQTVARIERSEIRGYLAARTRLSLCSSRATNCDPCALEKPLWPRLMALASRRYEQAGENPPRGNDP